MRTIFLRPYQLSDAEQLLQLNVKNQLHFEYWMPVKPQANAYTLKKQQERIEKRWKTAWRTVRTPLGCF